LIVLDAKISINAMACNIRHAGIANEWTAFPVWNIDSVLSAMTIDRNSSVKEIVVNTVVNAFEDFTIFVSASCSLRLWARSLGLRAAHQKCLAYKMH
jgi:hypothetical protein